MLEEQVWFCMFVRRLWFRLFLLNMIKDLPVDVLKLDGLFLERVNGDRDKAVIKVL